MPVTLDPDAAAVYKAYQEAGRPPYETVPPTTARELYLAGRVVSNPEPPELESAKPLSIPAPHGAIAARIYTPKTLRKTNGLAPCLIFYHGGGWVIGDLDSHDVVCRKLAHEGELIVISVDYRLAPEHKFPAAVDDAITAAKWIAAAIWGPIAMLRCGTIFTPSSRERSAMASASVIPVRPRSG